MFIKNIPQCSDDRLTYDFDGDRIIVTYEKVETQQFKEPFEQQIPKTNEDGETIYETIKSTQLVPRQVVVGTYTNVYDFSNVPDGILKSIKTDLLINPIISAKRENGTLYVELLYFYGVDATDEEKSLREVEVVSTNPVEYYTEIILAEIEWTTQDEIDEEKLEQILRPDQKEIDNAKLELKVIELLKEFEVIQ